MKCFGRIKNAGIFLAFLFVLTNSLFALEKKVDIGIPFIKTQWGDRMGKLQFSPERERARCDQVALAQVLYYYGISIKGSKSYATSKNVYWRDFDANPVNLNNLPLTYDDRTATDEQMKEYDTFLYSCAILLNQNWNDSVVYSMNYNNRIIAHVPATAENFYYGRGKEGDLTKQAFQDKIVESLKNKAPLIYSIESSDGVYSHAVVIDAAKTVGKTFQVHLNFGWNGFCDGWYDLWSPILVEDYTAQGGYRRYDSNERQIKIITPLDKAQTIKWKPAKLTSEQKKKILLEKRKVPEIVKGVLYIPEGTTFLSIDYKNNTSITKISFPSTFQGIYSTKYCFEGCKNLKEVEFPKATEYIISKSFLDCTKLEKVIYNGEFTDKNFTDAFKGCTNFKTAVFTSSSKAVPDHIFRNVSALTDVTFSQGIEKIGYGSFWNAVNLVNFEIPSSVTEIGGYAFYNTGISRVTIPASVQKIGDRAFSKSVKISCPEGSYAESWALSNGYTIEGRSNSTTQNSSTASNSSNNNSANTANTAGSTGSSSSTSATAASTNSSSSIASSSSTSSAPAQYTITNGKLVFESSTTQIEAGKFKGNLQIREVVIGENIVKIGNSAFEGCHNLKKIQFNAINLEVNNSSSVNIFKDCPVEELIFGPKVKVVPRQTFRNLNSLKSVHIPGNVKEVQQSAFYGDKAIEEITIDEGVETLVQYCFYGIPLKKITLPASISSIETNALPKSAQVICPSDSWVENFAIQNGNDVPSAFALSNGVLTIKEGIKTIPDNMYVDNTQIREIVIPSTITKIGDNAFKNCTNLTKVTYKAIACTRAGNGGENVTSAFIGCSKLSQLIITEGVTTIPANIFRQCPELKQITFPSSLKKINSSAFYKTSFEEIIIPEGMEEISYTCFSSNPNLKTVRLPSTITTIQNNAFDKRGVKFYVKADSYALQWCKSLNLDYVIE